MKVDIPKDVVENFDVFSPPGAALVTRFLQRKHGIEWQQQLSYILVSLKSMFHQVSISQSSTNCFPFSIPLLFIL